MTTVYVTKWALTTGILRSTTTEPTNDRNCIAVSGLWSGVSKPHWHTSRTDAIARAEDMRVKKIVSLEESLAKMKALTFEVEE